MAKGDKAWVEMSVTSVYEEVREWTSDDGKIHLFYVHGLFEDGSEWDIGVKEQNVSSTKARMHSQVQVPGMYELEDRGEYNDIQQFKVLNYPGKPGGASPPGQPGPSSAGAQQGSAQAASQGGSGGRSGDWETAPERMFKNLSIEAQGALGKLAVVAAACITTHETASTEERGGAVTVTKTVSAAFSPNTFHDIVTAMISDLDTLAAAVREAASQSPQGTPEAALSAFVAREAGEPSGNGSVASDAPLPQADPAERARMLNDLLAAHRTPTKVKAAWEDTWPDRGEAPDLANMTIAELAQLLVNAPVPASA